jgi:hypothetical protein
METELPYLAPIAEHQDEEGLRNISGRAMTEIGG